MYLLQIMDWYCATFSLMLLSFTECVVISWIYGVDRFLMDIELMIGHKPWGYWKIMWKFITPAVVLVSGSLFSVWLEKFWGGDDDEDDWFWCFSVGLFGFLNVFLGRRSKFVYIF